MPGNRRNASACPGRHHATQFGTRQMERDQTVVERHHLEHRSVCQRSCRQVRAERAVSVVDDDVSARHRGEIRGLDQVAERRLSFTRIAADRCRQRDAEQASPSAHPPPATPGAIAFSIAGSGLTAAPSYSAGTRAALEPSGIAARRPRVHPRAQVARREASSFENHPASRDRRRRRRGRTSGRRNRPRDGDVRRSGVRSPHVRVPPRPRQRGLVGVRGRPARFRPRDRRTTDRAGRRIPCTGRRHERRRRRRRHRQPAVASPRPRSSPRAVRCEGRGH